jgi:hypothetical protein
MTAAKQSECGLCIVTVERQLHHLMITVRTNQNLDHHLFTARPEDVERFADPGAALEATAAFLRKFTHP